MPVILLKTPQVNLDIELFAILVSTTAEGLAHVFFEL